MLKVKTQHKGAMSLVFTTQHKGAMSVFQMAQHKDATPITCKVEINNYTLNAKAQPPRAMPISKNAQHKSAMLWTKTQHMCHARGGEIYTQ